MTEKETQAKVGKLVAVKGMNDILPPDSAQWEWLEDKVRVLMGRYAYRNIRTPIVEPTALFVRGTGEAPAAPVFIDGEKRMTLRGDGIAQEFQKIVQTYVETRFGAQHAASAA